MAGEALKAVQEKTGGIKKKYDNYVNGKFVAPVKKQYFENISPVNGEVYCEAARSDADDIEMALDAAHAAKASWGKTSVTERANMLLKIADRMEQNLEKIATVEAWDKGKPIREAFAADIPLSIDHFRYFASAIRAQEGGISEIDDNTVAYHFHEPLGVVGQIIPWNFPILMAAWKLAPAIAAGNTVVMKPAEQTPVSIMHLMEIIGDLIPPGVVNIVNGFGVEAGKPLASSPRIAKVAFTGETSTGSLIMEYASKNITQVSLELGGKSPQIFMPDIFDKDDELADKAMESFAMFALNQGECCTCPSRALVHSSIYDRFMEKAIARVKTINVGNPLEFTTKVGAQASEEQMNKILKYFDIGRKEGAQVVIGGQRCVLEGEFKGGYYVQPTVFTGNNDMRVFREEIFGPVVSVGKFDTAEEALKIANDSEYGLAAAVWTRDYNLAYRMSRGIEAGRVWINSYHIYPAHSAFGGYKKSGFGRECHKMMLEHYQQTKNVVASYGQNALGFF